MTLISILLVVSSAFAQNQATRVEVKKAVNVDKALDEHIEASGDTRPIKPGNGQAPVRKAKPASTVPQNTQAAEVISAKQAIASTQAADSTTVNDTVVASKESVEKCLIGLKSNGPSMKQQLRVQYRRKTYAWNGNQILDLSDGSVVWSKNLDGLGYNSDPVLTANIKKAVLASQFEKSSAVQIEKDDDSLAKSIYSEFRDCKGLKLKLANGKTVDALASEKLKKIGEYYPGIEKSESQTRPAQGRTK